MQVRVSRRRESRGCGKRFVMKCNSRLNGEGFPETLDNKVSNSGFGRSLAPSASVALTSSELRSSCCRMIEDPVRGCRPELSPGSASVDTTRSRLVTTPCDHIRSQWGLYSKDGHAKRTRDILRAPLGTPIGNYQECSSVPDRRGRFVGEREAVHVVC
jgi:hypothetical protein